MKFHAHTYLRPAVEAEEPECLRQALAICEKYLQPAVVDLPDDFLSREAFDRLIPTLNMTSTPGHPYCKENPTIGAWLKWDGFKADKMRLDRLWFDTNLVLAGEYEHIMKCFVKVEPHKRQKILLKRWRLIIGFALPVQMAWKMLFDYSNVRMVEAAYDIPLQHGLVLFGGGWKQYVRQWKSNGLNCGTDASAWDWTVSGWLINAVRDLRERLLRGNPWTMDKYKTISRRLYEDAFSHAKILTPQGYVLEQQFDGLQKSGSPNTIGDNSMARFIASIVVSLKMGVTPRIGRFVGDDALERLPEDDPSFVETLIDTYKQLGIVIKGVEWGLEFVGHSFDHLGPQPLYIKKHLWKFQYVADGDLPTYLDAMCRYYCHSPHFELWEFFARRLGVKVFSKEYYRDWYDLDSSSFFGLVE